MTSEKLFFIAGNKHLFLKRLMRPREAIRIPIVSGSLILNEEAAQEALSYGAAAVSTSNLKVLSAQLSGFT